MNYLSVCNGIRIGSVDDSRVTCCDHRKRLFLQSLSDSDMSETTEYSFKVGDEVISPIYGFGKIVAKETGDLVPLNVDFGEQYFWINEVGKRHKKQFIFPINIGIVTIGPMTLDTTKPKSADDLQIDDPIIVKISGGKFPRHFAGLSDSGKVRYYADGKTSFTRGVILIAKDWEAAVDES